MQEKSPLVAGRSIADYLKENPARVKLFSVMDLDWIGDKEESLTEVISRSDIRLEDFPKILRDFDEAHEELKTLGLKTDMTDWPGSRVIGHITTNHHFYERKLLESLDLDLNKILRVHFDDHGEELILLHDLFAKLKMLLEVHYVREDSLYFPAIQDALKEDNVTTTLIADLENLEGEHHEALKILLDIEAATDGFTPPADGCATYQKAFSELKDLAGSVFIHFYKESIVLFDEVKRSIIS